MRTCGFEIPLIVAHQGPKLGLSVSFVDGPADYFIKMLGLFVLLVFTLGFEQGRSKGEQCHVERAELQAPRFVSDHNLAFG